eukprot:Blabericola_migrator_1__4575@NODE_2430_length_2777_cov_89_767528_g1522_i0_p2_GENE_NODE_2430_length_2777_cov_89_767528_g1522_i0NODE_2430_length_2777_cov_89_767528_g1522_i0_p2_ORF_typecomplete_len134_score14_59DUF778/PF05608_12/1_2e30DUF4796/PF16044_5/0_0004Peptidase_C97/PF05903_14/0_0014DUF4105/PF13387_6/0_0049FLILHELTA/PF10306_9/0_065LRAT/PF04970_13/0_067Frankia_peptide/PF14407_6/0_32_NODE_2430_length_2777_cov_89_767528_g1522_i020352436
MDVDRNLYPYSIVWTKLPLITAIVPLIGHTGVGDSFGIITDFAASYTIGRKRLVFGPVRRCWQLELDPEQMAAWDEAVKEINQAFAGKRHNIFTNNCHHHVAAILNRINYERRTNWGAVKIAWAVWTRGCWVS